jgi:pimeloyl-ACP methyl ester carboxylesterase
VKLRRPFLATLGLLALATGAVAWFRLVRPGAPPGFTWSNSSLSRADYLALGARPGWGPVEVPVEPPGGLALRGLLRPPRGEGRPWLLFFQGNSQHLLAEGQRFLEGVSGAEDLGLAVVAWRGYDGSPGLPGRDALLADAAAIARWLRADRARSGPLHLLAFSMGTLPAAATAVGLQRGAPAERPRSLTLLAPYTALRMFRPGWLSRYLTTERFDAMPVLAQVDLPTLVVHGDQDQTLPVEMGRAVAGGVAGSRLLVVPGAGHLDLLTNPEVHRAVWEMIRASR